MDRNAVIVAELKKRHAKAKADVAAIELALGIFDGDTVTEVPKQKHNRKAKATGPDTNPVDTRTRSEKMKDAWARRKAKAAEARLTPGADPEIEKEMDPGPQLPLSIVNKSKGASLIAVED